jgi:hypothetical protein
MDSRLRSIARDFCFEFSIDQTNFLNITSRIDDVLKSYERLLGLGERTESTAQGLSKCEARDGSNRCESSPHATFFQQPLNLALFIVPVK